MAGGAVLTEVPGEVCFHPKYCPRCNVQYITPEVLTKVPDVMCSTYITLEVLTKVPGVMCST